MNKTISLLAVALLAAGCASEVPLATTHPMTLQQKLKSASHWGIIAKDTAQQAMAGLAKAGMAGVPVTVSTQQPTAPFQEGFRTFLITHLVESGQPVMQSGADVDVQFEAQVVHKPTKGHATIPGEWTALAVGVSVIRNAYKWGDNEQLAGVLGLAALADLSGGYATPVTKTEVIVTTSVLRAGKYIARKTDVYYVDDADGSLYEQMKVWTWKVVG
jgi:hypothetical protein